MITEVADSEPDKIKSFGGVLGSGSDLGDEVDLYLVWQLLLSYLSQLLGKLHCDVALLPERKLKVHNALFTSCLVGCHYF